MDENDVMKAIYEDLNARLGYWATEADLSLFDIVGVLGVLAFDIQSQFRDSLPEEMK